MNDKKRTEYAIKQVEDRYYPIITKEAGVHYAVRVSGVAIPTRYTTSRLVRKGASSAPLLGIRGCT